MSKRNKWFISAAIVAVLVIIGYVFYHETHEPAKAPQIPPTVVDASTATAQSWNLRIPATGNLVASQGIMIKSAVQQGGIITGIFFRSGQYVKAGQPLFQINPGENRTMVNAPFSGRVGLKQVNLGSYVTIGSNLVSIEDVTPIKIDFTIPQSYLSYIAIGDTTLINVNTYPNETFQGQVYAINAALSQDSRSIEMWASIPNEDQKLLPQMFANITLVVAHQVPVVVVPNSAVSYSDSGNSVFVIDKGIARREQITIGMTVGNQVGVTKGLKGGEQVVSSNTDQLDDGWPVIVKGTPEYQKYEADQASNS